MANPHEGTTCVIDDVDPIAEKTVVSCARGPAGFPCALDGHIPVLDGVRGVAILLVMAYHFLHPGAHFLAVLPNVFARAGWVGVDLFFVLSGFLITGILMRTKTGPHYFRNFYMRRTLRIFPLYYAFLTFLFVAGSLVSALNTPEFREVAKQQIWLWTYTTNLGQYWTGELVFQGGWVEANHFWSLAVEEQFYFVWPAIVWYCSRRAIKPLCVCLIVGAFLFRIVSEVIGADMTLWRADALIIGALIAVLVRDDKWAPRMQHLAQRIQLVSGLLLVGIFAWRGGFTMGDPVVRAVGTSVLEIFFGATLVVVLALPRTHVASRFFSWSLLKSFGKYSYGLYIFHWALNPLVLDPLFPGAAIRPYMGSWLVTAFAQCALKIGASFAIAWLSWHLYEKHFLKLKRVFASRTDVKADPR